MGTKGTFIPVHIVVSFNPLTTIGANTSMVIESEEELEQLKKHMRKLIKSGLSDKDIMDIIDKMRQ
jgi:hypothetical protein